MHDGEVKNKLSPAQVSVMRHKVTEPPYFGKYWDHFEPGSYACAACGTALFSSDDKFDSKTGWPSFKRPISESRLQFKNLSGPDDKVEVRCKKCKSHLGFIIASADSYYRINSVALSFERSPQSAAKAASKTATPAEVKPAAPAPQMPAAQTGTYSIVSVLAALVIGSIAGALGTYEFMILQSAASVPQSATSTIETPLSTSSDSLAPAENDIATTSAQ